ncbi:MAG TPA: hypothetical protein ENH45_06740 [Nitrospirae bacterium]|nr:hypothetical protein BMS3Abin09_00682 [bacterium BMS3Abin09]GBE40656.1 hypothetical protein BMS3Bbin09_00542 [bacterium BMS3Bbin09]HDN94835.1 hypothetical protein [Nitrospirota bacterium]HDO67538.1 hypothetical protein [Nitrospirota bacterium]HDZ84901.1 hypothetical protein [Nitrospirota bacterium]
MAGQRITKKNIVRDRDIDLYCESVEKLLCNISKKNSPTPRKQILTDEFEFTDHNEDYLEL